MEAPSWIDAEVWLAFVEMRKAKGKRAPFTDRAAKMIVNELDRLRGVGHNPDEVLKQSVMNGWSGVFPLKLLTLQPQQPSFPTTANNSWLAAHNEHMAAPIDKSAASAALERMASIKKSIRRSV